MRCEAVEPVLNSNGDAIGFKRTLEFFDGYPTNADSTKIECCIQEYSTAQDVGNDWLLCQIISTAEPEGMNPVAEVELHSIPYLITKPRLETIGMHFDPSDQELVLDYLATKNTPSQLVEKPYVKVIPEAAVYQSTPEQLSDNYPYLEENEWYFFSDTKFVAGAGANTGDGQWKAKFGEITVHAGGRKVGSKVELRFYRAKGTGSKWVIDEYSSEDQNQTWVLCVMRTLSSKRKRQEMDKD